jgi:hypothetical protein
MTRFVFALLFVSAPLFAADKPKPKDAKAAAKKAAQAMGDASVKGDDDAAYDLMYEPAVKAVGGKEELIRRAKAGRKTMEDIGWSLTSYTVDDPGDLHTEGDNVFVVVTATTEGKTPTGKVLIPAAVLGISSDGGKTWKFVDVKAARNAEMKKKVLPKLPAKLELPEPKPPKVVKE